MTATLVDSELLNDRERIRSNDAINILLWDNKALLQKLFMHFKIKKSFTAESTEKLIEILNEVNQEHNHFISRIKLIELFRMS